MKIGLIGCGGVGVTMAKLLQKRHRICGVYDVDKNRERRAAGYLAIKKNPDYRRLVADSRLLLVATTDREIIPACRKLAGYLVRPTVVLQFSGLQSAGVMPRNPKIIPGSLHPFFSFPRVMKIPDREKIFLFFQGDARARRVVRRTFGRLNFVVATLPERDKTFYHILGVTSSNLLVGLVLAADEIRRRLRWPRSKFQKTALAMMRQTIDNIERFGINAALSGPLRRGDADTVKKHLRALVRRRDLRAVYTALSRYLVNRHPLAGSSAAEKRRLRRAIDSTGKCANIGDD